MRISKSLVVLHIFIIQSFAFAGDGNGKVGMGSIELEKNNAIVVQKEDVFASPDLVRVQYDLKNKTDQPFVSTFTFPFPWYAPLADCNDNEEICTRNKRIDRTIRSLKVKVNGKPIKFQTTTKAFKNKKEITDILKQFGIDMEDAKQATAQMDKLSEVDSKKLEKLGISNVSWQLQKVASWEQTFAANQITVVAHEYQPIPGRWEGLPTPGSHEADMRRSFAHSFSGSNDNVKATDYCMTKGDQKKIIDLFEIKERPKYAVYYENLTYFLKSLNSWNEPVEEFHLRIDLPKNTTLSTCYKGLTKTGEQLETTIQNFSPSENLHVLFAKRGAKLGSKDQSDFYEFFK